MSNKWSIDRIEEDMAVCINDNNDIISVSLDELPKEIKEGDVLICEEEKYFIDNSETERIREEVRHLLKDLFR